MVEPGQVPPNPMFHMRRFAHISDSCVNCGQCEELCRVEIRLALFSHAIRAEQDAIFAPKFGKPTLLQLKILYFSEVVSHQGSVMPPGFLLS